MIDRKDIEEVRNRDFLKKANHYRYLDDIKTHQILGSRLPYKSFLSIVVPVYNHPIEFIKRAILSVLYQQCDYTFEMLVIDDFAQNKGVSETERFLRELNDERITYYKNEQNLGVFGNWNRGIELANSDWVMILHTDDFCKNNYLQNMKDILDKHPEIDQLTCNYKLLNFLDSDIDVGLEYQGDEKSAFVRKVKYTEYLYGMVTSVKGSFYRRQCLLDIGGFRSQNNGIGLDDYPLMMRYAYYYNTYLIEDVLYLDSWGYNDSLNTKHWYPELVENYYMWLYFANRESKLLQGSYKARARYLLKKRALDYANGTSWVGVKVPIDFDQLKEDCSIDYMRGNRVEELACLAVTKLAQGLKNRPHRGFKYKLKAYSCNEILV